MRRLLHFCLVSLAFFTFIILGYRMIHRSILSDGVKSICDIVAEHFYRTDGAFQRWVEGCYVQASAVEPWESKAAIVAKLQDWMDELQVSHFHIYSPKEDQKIWKGEAEETGIRARWVEDHLVVFRVLKGSGGEKAGIKPGDDIVRINESTHISPWGAQNSSGPYEIERNKQKKILAVEVGPLHVDEAPQLRVYEGSIGILEISSFRSEFFEAEAWRKLAGELQRFSGLIVDIRDNAGGNFVAMLRALSTFYCAPRDVGVLVQPRKSAPDLLEISDKTEDDFQISELDKYHSIQLKSFGSYGCYSQPVTVLINSDTASVSEIFAHAMKSRPNTRVWGQPSSGDVVLAVWYDLPLFGKGYSISIPEAVYLTEERESLERSGVWPEQELFYDLPTALRGEDSWLERAAHQPY